VCFDFTFYGPAAVRQLQHYASLVPADFQACAKVWEEITVPIYPSGLRYRSKTGPNSHFLDPDYFLTQVLAPFDEAFREHTGPFIFEFQRSGLDPATFLPKMDAFFERMPKAYEYAVEVGNTAVLGPGYREILHAHGVSHIYNHLYAMPTHRPATRQTRRPIHRTIRCCSASSHPATRNTMMP
jgi:uncharacterized protein YecE (DUF72 family)